MPKRPKSLTGFSPAFHHVNVWEPFNEVSYLHPPKINYFYMHPHHKKKFRTPYSMDPRPSHPRPIPRVGPVEM